MNGFLVIARCEHDDVPLFLCQTRREAERFAVSLTEESVLEAADSYDYPVEVFEVQNPAIGVIRICNGKPVDFDGKLVRLDADGNLVADYFRMVGGKLVPVDADGNLVGLTMEDLVDLIKHETYRLTELLDIVVSEEPDSSTDACRLFLALKEAFASVQKAASRQFDRAIAQCKT